MKKLAMHWKILIGMIVGLLFDYVKNLEQKLLLTGLNRSEPSLYLLKMIAVPLIVVSLIVGYDLKDIQNFQNWEGGTILFMFYR
jgi:Na+/H+-dicarboxylate symporter